MTSTRKEATLSTCTAVVTVGCTLKCVVLCCVVLCCAGSLFVPVFPAIHTFSILQVAAP